MNLEVNPTIRDERKMQFHRFAEALAKGGKIGFQALSGCLLIYIQAENDAVALGRFGLYSSQWVPLPPAPQ